MRLVREECGCCLWQRPIFSAACGEEKRRGEGHTHCPFTGPLPYPPPLPAPLPGDEWWYLLKVKPAGELWLGLGGRGRLLGRSQGQTQQKAALQSRMHCWGTSGETGNGRETRAGAQTHSSKEPPDGSLMNHSREKAQRLQSMENVST